MLKSLIYLGECLSAWLNDHDRKSYTSDDSAKFSELISNQHLINNWHSEQGITAMLRHLSDLLTQNNIKKWIDSYPGLTVTELKPKRVQIKPNPDYSFAGIQEWLCSIITQTPFIIEADNNQFLLLKFLCQKLIDHNASFSVLFNFTSDKFSKPEQFILYSEKKNDSIKKYFSNKKAFIVEPRPSLAILAGNETEADLSELGKDIFMHLGQSNRTLRKIFAPSGFEIRKLIAALEPYASVYRNNKYANNYDYHQSVYLMNRIPFLDNGFLLFKEDKQLEAPTGCLFYEYYNNLTDVIKVIESVPYENLISTETLPLKSVRPGKSHFFSLSDYPNKKDLIEFLIS